jgi:DNA-binding transcriptional regulator YiaG
MENAQTRTLKRALEIVGSREWLAETLGVALSDLSAWLEGVRCPHEVFLQALDIVARGLRKPEPKPSPKDICQ